MAEKTNYILTFFLLSSATFSIALETDIDDIFFPKKEYALLSEQAFEDLMIEFSINEKDQWTYHYFLGKNMTKAIKSLYLIQKFSQIPDLETFENQCSHKNKFSFFYEKDFGIIATQESVDIAYKNLLKFYLRPKIRKNLHEPSR